MAIDMQDAVSDDIGTIPATLFSQSGSRGADGKWVAGVEGAGVPYDVILQPVTDKELINLGAGGERIQDFRKIYLTDVGTISLTPEDEWEFNATGLNGVRFKVYAMDNRPWRNYCKCVVARVDR